ncbi:hypothetical protein KL936_002973 [Ogataea polymorpha]|nr:hypothetical protein KL936_002973 [Ogataea polymorpha]
MSTEYSDVQLFVRPIGPHVTHEEVEEYFSQVGPLKELRLMPGYAFVEYPNPETAEKAFSEFLEKPFAGEPLQIEYAKKKPEYAKKGENRVKVSNLPPTTAWQDFKDFIREEVRLTPTFVRIPPEDPTICHLEFASREDLESAISQLNGVNYRDTQLVAEEDTSPYIASASRTIGARRGGYRGGRGFYRGGRGGYPSRGRGGFGGPRDYPPYRGPPRGDYGGYPPRGGYGPPPDGPVGSYGAPRGPSYRDYGPPPVGGPPGPAGPGGYRGGRGGYPPRGGYREPRGGYRDYDRGYRDGPPAPRGEYRSREEGAPYPEQGEREYARERSPARY